MIFYIYSYLVIGVISLVIIYTSHHLSKDKGLKFSVDEILDSLDPKRRTLSYRILNNFIAPAMAAILIVIAWPAAIYMKVTEILETKAMAAQEIDKEEAKKFKVSRADLIEELSISQIELSETVRDPLNSVPNLPFGHFNTKWLEFVNSVSTNDVLWSFCTSWTSDWGSQKTVSGYVIVNTYGIGPHFITSNESNNDSSE